MPKYSKEKTKEWTDRYRLKHPNRRLYSIAKRRAKIKNIEFSISMDDILIPEYCPILGLKLQVNIQGQRGGMDNSYSLDRIDNTKGYIPGNIQVISNKANSMKFTATPDELKKFAEWIRKFYV